MVVAGTLDNGQIEIQNKFCQVIVTRVDRGNNKLLYLTLLQYLSSIDRRINVGRSCEMSCVGFEDLKGMGAFRGIGDDDLSDLFMLKLHQLETKPPLPFYMFACEVWAELSFQVLRNIVKLRTALMQRSTRISITGHALESFACFQ